MEFGVLLLKNSHECFREALLQAKRQPSLVLYADWCGPCKMMPPILREVREKLDDSIRILKIDVQKNLE